MKFLKALPRKQITAVTLLAACVAVGGATAWNASTHRAEASSKQKQNLQERLQRGVGSEVRFASAAATKKEIDEAIASTTDFIYRRSGLQLSAEVKQRLAKSESKVLKGETQRITIAELTDNLTSSAVDRLTKLTDKEIQQGIEMSSDEHGEFRPRADKWSGLTKEELIQQARSGRDMSRSDTSAFRSALHPIIEQEVNDRVNILSTVLPERFGESRTQGITPSQALLISYSVAADDPLMDSRGDIDQLMAKKRVERRLTREQRKTRKDVSSRPYGPYGQVHPSAAHLFFSKDGVDKLLKLEGGEK
jgi:hypothetical protein